VPLLALLAVPGAIRLWKLPAGRIVVIVAVGWSALTTALLQWLPLSGYVDDGRYFVDDVREATPILAPFDIFPAIAPRPSSNLLGLGLLAALWLALCWVLLRRPTVAVAAWKKRPPD
jgi:hypothetical protein